MRLIDEFDRFIRRDPARRGLISSEPQFGPVCPGHLAAAAEHLASSGRKVGIVTGFYIPRGDPPAAETDGPPGALLLAQALHLAGIETTIITDPLCLDAVRAAATEYCFPPEYIVASSPSSIAPTLAPDLTHLISIERVGPSHTLDSLTMQPRPGQVPVEAFAQKVPPEHRDRCHNMPGEIVDTYAGDLHRIFENAPRLFPSAKTIGIGDGANEIGMGAIPWEDLERRLSGEHSGWIPCRIACDFNIVAGTSNWGACALAAAVLHLRGQTELLQAFDAEHEQRVLSAMVARGPAVDGVTRRREPTVDGLPFLTYIQPWLGIRRLLALDRPGERGVSTP